MKILLAEDHDHLREILEDYLVENDYEVKSFDNGEDARKQNSGDMKRFCAREKFCISSGPTEAAYRRRMREKKSFLSRMKRRFMRKAADRQATRA